MTKVKHKSFDLLESESFTSYKVDYFVFEHKSTGAKVYFFKKKDKRSSFLIEFLTPPENSKGVQHIIEHLLLSGSEKYDFGNKDPFFDLLQKKLLSNINASTYPERTRYYFEAIRKKDFFDTLDIYLDAVFNPIFLKRPILFKREAWRIDKDPSGKYIYSGTVLNEMRTASAQPLRILEQAIAKSVFGKSIYDNDSGGLPDEIIKLKYEELTDYYERHYHPSNSRTILFGDMDIDKSLSKLDEYFGKYERNENLLKKNIKLLPKAKNRPAKVTLKYPGQAEDSYMAITFKGAPKSDSQESLALALALSVAFSETGSVREAISESNLCADFSYFEDYDYFYNPIVIFYFMRVLPKNFGKLKKVFLKELNNLKKTGLNKDLLHSKLESMRLAEEISKSSPELSAKLLKWAPKFFWVEDPQQVLRQSEILQEIKQEFERNPEYFDRILDKYILSQDVFFEARAQADEKLEWFPNFNKAGDKLQKISGKKKDNIEKGIREYAAFSNNSKGKSSIKASKVSSVRYASQVKVDEKDRIKIFYKKMPTSNWVHADLFFDISHLSDKDLQNLQLVSLAFSKFATSKHSASELEILKSALMNFNMSLLNLSSDANRKVFLHFSLQYLKENEDRALELSKEIISDTVLDIKKIEYSAREYLSATRNSLSGLGARQYGQIYSESFLDNSAKIEDLLSGISFLQFLSQVNFEASKLQKVWERAIQAPYALAYASGRRQTKLEELLAGFDNKKPKPKKFKENKKMSSKVVALSSNLFSNNFNFLSFKLKKSNPDMKLLNSALQYGLFPEELRDKGGAYGAFALCNAYCDLFSFGTYTDPHIKRTFDIFEKAYAMLSELDEKDLQLAKVRLAFPALNPVPEFLLPKKEFILQERGSSSQKENQILNKLLKLDTEKIKRLTKKTQDLLDKSPKIKLTFIPPRNTKEFKKNQIRHLGL